MPEELRKEMKVRAVMVAYGKAAVKYPYFLFGAFCGIFLIEIANVVGPIYLSKFINLLTKNGPSSEVVHALFITLFMFSSISFVSWLGQRLRMYTVLNFEARAMKDLYATAFAYLIGHSHDFFISHFAGTLTRRVTRYVNAFEQVLDNVLLNFSPALVYVVGIIGVLSMKNIWLGVGIFVWTVFFVLIQILMARWKQTLRTARTAEDSRVTGLLSDVVANHSTVTIFAAAPFERLRFGETVTRWYQATIRAWSADIWIFGVQGILAIGIEFGLLGGSVFLWQKGILTVGDFVLIQIYVLGLFDRTWGIGRNMRQLYDAFSDASEMVDILETPHDIMNVPRAVPLSVSQGAIHFQNVEFRYGEGMAVLQKFNLSVAPREKVALVGSSGAGKSTITKLLLRLYNVSGGAILIDKQNIAQVSQESLRASIAFVPQEPLLFHRTLMENIRYGRPEATDAEVIEAAKQAHCLEFIKQYPSGFETYVGERGVKLSGGERQRVAIARAILKNAPILVLDEATSSLDSESEALIQDALANLMQGKTIIAIAHRLSTIMKMDKIIVMEKGNVVLSGSHDELLAQESNLYKKLWEIQAGGFLK